MPKQENNQNTGPRISIIEAVQRPINFFVLVVLVVEAILGITVNFSQGADRTYLILGMLALIFMLVLIVAGLAFFRPEALSGKRPVTRQRDDIQPHDTPTDKELSESQSLKLKLQPAYEILMIPGYDLSLISEMLEGLERLGNVDSEAFSRVRNITPSTVDIIINSMKIRGYLQTKEQGLSLTDSGRELLGNLRIYLRPGG
jgi:hypothetical protein